MSNRKQDLRFTGSFHLSGRFPVPDLTTWESTARKGLKGRQLKDLETLLPEGFRTHVLYSHENSSADPGVPGHSPFLRGSETETRPWISCALIDASRPEDAFRHAAYAAGRDARALWLRFADPWAPKHTEAGIRNTHDLDLVLGDLDPREIQIHLDAGADSLKTALQLVDYCRRRDIPTAELRASFGLDPAGSLACNGSLPGGTEAHFRAAAAMTAWSRENCPLVRSLLVSALPCHRAGASAVEELGIILASCVEWLRRLERHGIPAADTAASLLIRVPMGRDLFTGIAKLRALRALWAQLSSHCGIGHMPPPPVHAVGSERSLSCRDPWVNILRQTTECFAAVTGGAEIVTTLPYDSLLREPEEPARRLALNTQTILREECHLDRITDPAGGSWYLEELSRRLAENSWNYFREVESSGGLIRALEAGSIQARLGKKRRQLEEGISSRKIPVTGVSTWARIEKEIPPRRRLDRPAPPPAPGFSLASINDKQGIEAALEVLRGESGTLGWPSESGKQCPPLVFIREAESFESLQERAARLARQGRNIGVFLLKLGPASETTELERFAVNFFAAGGIPAAGEGGFTSTADGVAALSGATTRRVCILGNTDHCEEMFPKLLPALKEASAGPIYLAGRGGTHEEAWREAGIDDFIHSGMDVLAFLNAMLDEVEVQS